MGCLALAALVLATASPAVRADVTYTITDLGTFVGGELSYANGVNDSAQVVGFARYVATGSIHGFSWTSAGGMVDVGDLGYSLSFSEGVNDSGQVAGYSENTGAQPRAFLWTSAGGMVDLGKFSWAYDSYAYGINSTGQVVGFCGNTGGDVNHAFLWSSADGMVDLGTLGGTSSTAWAINDSGEVAGESTTDTGDDHAFVWSSANGMIDLGTLGDGTGSVARAINASGQVAGYAYVDALQYHAFVYADNTMVDLGTLGGSQSYSRGINDYGEVVGWADTSAGQRDAFLYYGGTMTDLNNFFAGTGWILSEATGINNAGQIVGYGTYNGNGRAFLLTPNQALPEPNPALLFITALPLGLLWFRRRRWRAAYPAARAAL